MGRLEEHGGTMDCRWWQPFGSIVAPTAHTDFEVALRMRRIVCNSSQQRDVVGDPPVHLSFIGGSVRVTPSEDPKTLSAPNRPAMPLVNVREPFDHPEWLFEPKWNGLRALAYIEQGQSRLVSRRGHIYKAWPHLAEEIAGSVRCENAVLDGELCCLAPDGRSEFYSLMFRRDRPFYMAFDLLWLDGRDLRRRSLTYRKQQLSRIVPRSSSSRVRYVDHIAGRGVDLFKVACDYDLEGIVAKWAGADIHDESRVDREHAIACVSFTDVDRRVAKSVGSILSHGISAERRKPTR
jgi:hypothetical protein